MPKFNRLTGYVSSIQCKHCCNEDIMKNGVYYGLQYFRCKKCNHRFNEKNTFIGYRFDKDTITKAMTYYYGGMSLRAVKNAFDDLENMKISNSTLWDWVYKFTKSVIPYVTQLKPMYVGNSWFADETVIKLHGKKRWLWSVIDEDTRYILSYNFTPHRTTKNATKLLYDAYLHAGRKPYTVSTDKLYAYNKAFNKVFYTRYLEDKAYHLKSHGFASPTNINLIERFHEYIKQRTKTMRYFKDTKSAKVILQGIIINYNFLWEHSYLNYVPPAQKAGIDIQSLGIKNWGDLIDLAISCKNEKPYGDKNIWYVYERNRINGGYPSNI